MRISEDLSAALAAADEDYLIGLCNKGTVNRAKKDLAALTSLEAVPENGGMTVKLGDITCSITSPLGESRCSCPSSAICRHRIAAILWLKQQLDGGPPAAAPPPGPALQELRAYPPEKLVKQLGAKRSSAALFRHQSGGGPEIAVTSVVTVEMPWLPASVRLLEPLEHSSCTCHSKTFCSHKAEALLYWQLKEGIADPSVLRTARPAGTALDLEAVQGVCRAVQDTLTSHLTIGLSRLPPSVCETVERMAALCHTAKLPELERALRALHGEYAAYFARSATYRDAALLQRISTAFRLAGALEAADEETAPSLAGTFRDDYLPSGDLKLYLLGMREFSGRSGYAGTIYYFWERDTHRSYTFTHVRPTFYEKEARRHPSAAVPWGLPCPLHQAWNFSMDLTNAKATRTGNLSASELCQATLLGPCDPGRIYPEDRIYTDFASLLEQRSAPHAPERERLAVVRPQRCEPQPYDTVRQTFTMRLLDGMGRDLWLEVRYKKEEAKVVDRLEQLADSLRAKPHLSPVFFGIVYREDDRLKFYPIESFTEWGRDA